jgi:hypothetical protein
MSKRRFSIIPRYAFRSITDITPDFLQQQGIKFLMLDLDNTAAGYDEHSLSEHISKWSADMKENGIRLFIISNSKRKNRVESFSKALGADFVMNSRKPSPKGLLSAMAISGSNADESAFAGDQVFTDTLAANRAGVASIIVRPVRFTNVFLALRYYIEIPIRAMCKSKFGVRN